MINRPCLRDYLEMDNRIEENEGGSVGMREGRGNGGKDAREKAAGLNTFWWDSHLEWPGGQFRNPLLSFDLTNCRLSPSFFGEVKGAKEQPKSRKIFMREKRLFWTLDWRKGNWAKLARKWRNGEGEWTGARTKMNEWRWGKWGKMCAVDGVGKKKRTLGKAFCPLPSFFGPTPPFLPIDCRPILSARRPSHFFARLFHQPIQKPFLLPPISPFSSHLLNLKSRYGQSAGRKKVSEGRRKDDWTINNPPLFTLMLNANAVDSFLPQYSLPIF